jgi:hypothetical protein
VASVSSLLAATVLALQERQILLLSGLDVPATLLAIADEVIEY